MYRYITYYLFQDFIASELPPPPTPPEEIERRRLMAEELERLTREEEERERLKAYKLEHPEEEEEEEYDADSKPSKKSSIRIFYIIKQH